MVSKRKGGAVGIFRKIIYVIALFVFLFSLQGYAGGQIAEKLSTEDSFVKFASSQIPEDKRQRLENLSKMNVSKNCQGNLTLSGFSIPCKKVEEGKILDYVLRKQYRTSQLAQINEKISKTTDYLFLTMLGSLLLVSVTASSPRPITLPKAFWKPLTLAGAAFISAKYILFDSNLLNQLPGRLGSMASKNIPKVLKQMVTSELTFWGRSFLATGILLFIILLVLKYVDFEEKWEDFKQRI